MSFCDLRGFTNFSETAEPEEALSVLRGYHAAMGEVIFKHEGTLEHFEGDGMMVFFNDPLAVPDPTLRAIRMALEMHERFAALSAGWRKRGYDLGLGIGIALGHATLGRIGFEGRFDYGAIGTVVILAQRLSAEAKAGETLVTQRAFGTVEDAVEGEETGPLALKGFQRPVPARRVTKVREGTTAPA